MNKHQQKNNNNSTEYFFGTHDVRTRVYLTYIKIKNTYNKKYPAPPTPATIVIIAGIEYTGGSISRVAGVSSVRPRTDNGTAAINIMMIKIIVPVFMCIYLGQENSFNGMIAL